MGNQLINSFLKKIERSTFVFLFPQKHLFADVLHTRYSEKFRKIHRETPLGDYFCSRSHKNLLFVKNLGKVRIYFVKIFSSISESSFNKKR